MKQLKQLPRLSERTRIDEIINDPSTSLKDLLFFDIAVDPSKIDIRILRYFLNHFDQFVSCILGISNIGRQYQVACARILLFHFDFFIENTNILNIFYDYAFKLDEYSEISYTAYFTILRQIIFENPTKINESLRKEFRDPRYFEIIFSRLDISQNFYFIMQTITDIKLEFRSFLKKCNNLFNIVLLSVLSDSPILVERGQLVLFTLIRNTSIDNAPLLLLKDNAIDKVIQSKLDHPTNGGFLFLKELYLLSGTFSSHFWSIIPKSNSFKWKVVKSIIMNYFGQYCSFIINSDFFNDKVNGCCKLCMTLFSHQKKINPYYVTCLEKLFQMFFKYPTNTFLHETCYQIILGLKKKRLLTPLLIEQLSLSDEIIECYKQRDNNQTSAYWGHLRLISELITNSKLKKNQKWKEIVISENNQREEIIKHEYGGFNRIQNSPIFLYTIIIISILLITFLFIYCFASLK